MISQLVDVLSWFLCFRFHKDELEVSEALCYIGGSRDESASTPIHVLNSVPCSGSAELLVCLRAVGLSPGASLSF